jgi:hypothetical protein
MVSPPDDRKYCWRPPEWRRSRNLVSLSRANARPARRAGPIVRPPLFRPEWADEGGQAARSWRTTPGVATSGQLGLPPKATQPRVRPRRGTTPLPEAHGCGCQQSHLAQLARPEVELGLPGLLRRPQHRSHTSGTGPTPRLDLSPRRMDLTQSCGDQPHRLVPPYASRSVEPSPGGGSARSHRLAHGLPHITRNLLEARTGGSRTGVWPMELSCLPPRSIPPGCGKPRERACGVASEACDDSSWPSTRQRPTPPCPGHAGASRSR